MRSVPQDFDPQVVAAIDARLDAIVVDHAVSVPWAIESGSRAWGFASPDSDYDCRFLFVRPRSAYVALWPERDVIETPLQGLLDVNGWDLAKAVRLAARGNATPGEWLRSPHVYRGDPAFRDDVLAVLAEVVDPAALRRHYVHVGRAQWDSAEEGPGRVRLKRVFYAVRPAATLCWLDEHEGVPPMNLDELLAQVRVPDDVRAEVAALRELKARTRELGTAAVPPAIGTWVAETLRGDDEAAVPSLPPADVRARAEQGFARLLERWAPAAD